MQNLFEFEKNDYGYTLTKYNGGEEKVVLPDTHDGEDVTIIGKEAFYLNLIIKEVTLPKELKIIESDSFRSCVFLEKIKLPNTLTMIGATAFEDCGSLKEITIPPLVKIINPRTFDRCESLSKVTLNEGLEIIKFTAFSGCVLLEEIVLPASLTQLEHYVFSRCVNLKYVTLINPETTLATKVFSNCKNLEQVSFTALPILPIEQQVKLLGNEFYKNNDFSTQELAYIKKKRTLKKMFFKGDYPEIISILLNQKTKLKLEELDEYINISIKENRTTITAIYLDYKSKNFSSEDISTANDRKDALEMGFELPTLKEFKQKWSCSNKDGVIRVSGYKGSHTHATIPACLSDGIKISLIGHTDSNNYIPLEVLTIEAEITTLESSTFSNCETLCEIILPDTLVSIGDLAFSNCTSLKEITIPASVKTIGELAFYNCSSLTMVNFLGERPTLGQKAFFCCPANILV